MTTAFSRHLRQVLAAALSGVVMAASPQVQQPAEQAATPRVTALEPADGSTTVDPQTTTHLTVVFDQPMDAGRHAVCGGGLSFPPVVNTKWVDDRTFGMQVNLEADRIYAMELACATSSGFRAQAGGMLAPLPWRFATSGPPLAEAVIDRAATNLFAAIRDHYAHRDNLGVDWARLERDYHAKLAACRTGASLALAIADMLASAQDLHITIDWRGAVVPTHVRRVTGNFDVRGLRQLLPKLTPIGRIGFSARTDDDIGYLFVGTFAHEQRRDFEQVLQVLRTLQDCKGMIIDVRTNSGGDELLARRLAAFFVEGEKVYAAHRIRDPKAKGGFREREERRVRGNAGPDVFRGPIAVLMGPLNMSSCEAFLLMMKQAPRAFLVGERSYGSSGNPQPHELMAGLTVMLPSWQALRPDGSMFEGEGIAPHLHVATTPEQLEQADPVLEEALLRLRGKR